LTGTTYIYLANNDYTLIVIFIKPTIATVDMKPKSIALILPNTGNKGVPTWQREIIFSSLTLDAVAASVTTDAEITFFDESMEKIDFDRHYDVVGISINTATANR
jgi:hypothetical protein